MTFPAPDEEERRVYFDDVDEDMDGFGWNTITPHGFVACRYATLEEALREASNDLKWEAENERR